MSNNSVNYALANQPTFILAPLTLSNSVKRFISWLADSTVINIPTHRNGRHINSK